MAHSIKTQCVPPGLDAQGAAALSILIQTAIMELDVDGFEPLTITPVTMGGNTTGFLLTAQPRKSAVAPVTLAPAA
jgi:hypothetical protein